MKYYEDGSIYTVISERLVRGADVNANGHDFAILLHKAMLQSNEIFPEDSNRVLAPRLLWQ